MKNISIYLERRSTMNYFDEENNILVIDSSGMIVAQFKAEVARVAREFKRITEGYIDIIRKIGAELKDAFRDYLDLCEDALEIDHKKQRQQFRFVVKIEGYKRPYLTYRYFHRGKRRERGE